MYDRGIPRLLRRRRLTEPSVNHRNRVGIKGPAQFPRGRDRLSVRLGRQDMNVQSDRSEVVCASEHRSNTEVVAVLFAVLECVAALLGDTRYTVELERRPPSRGVRVCRTAAGAPRRRERSPAGKQRAQANGVSRGVLARAARGRHPQNNRREGHTHGLAGALPGGIFRQALRWASHTSTPSAPASSEFAALPPRALLEQHGKPAPRSQGCEVRASSSNWTPDGDAGSHSKMAFRTKSRSRSRSRRMNPAGARCLTRAAGREECIVGAGQYIS